MKNKKQLLLEHQLSDLNEIKFELKKYGRTCMIRPMGYGKSYIGFKLASEYKHAVFIYPYTSLKEAMSDDYSDIISGLESYTPISYQKIAISGYEKILQNELRGLNHENTLIIMDEVHCACADVTKVGIEGLMKYMTHASILGITATPGRSDNQNPVTDLFDSHKISDYDIRDAIEDGIFNPPCYVGGDFKVDNSLIKLTQSQMVKKKANGRLANLTNKLVKSSTAETEEYSNMFHKHLTNFASDLDYMKIIMFFPTIETLQRQALQWGITMKKAFPEHSIHTIQIHTGDKHDDLEILKTLHKTKEKRIDLILSVDMLNFGYHVDDITAVVMLRNTRSDTVYIQQAGRVFDSWSDKTPIIFDLVGNNEMESLYTNKHKDYENYNSYRSSIKKVFGKVHFFDERKDFKRIKRLVNIMKNPWLDVVIDAFLNKGAPLEYCLKKLNVTEEEFLNIVNESKSID